MLPETAGYRLMDHVVRHFVAVAFSFRVKIGALFAFHPDFTGQIPENNTYISHNLTIHEKCCRRLLNKLYLIEPRINNVGLPLFSATGAFNSFYQKEKKSIKTRLFFDEIFEHEHHERMEHHH
jgi:hypothetical protein